MINKVWNFVQQEHMFEAHDYVVAGVSGGADSVCLLFMLLEIRKRIPLTIHVVHVNHGLRPEAVEEAAFVEALCKKHQISFTLVEKRVDEIAAQKHISTEEAGREVRYEAFEQVLAEHVQNSKIVDGKIAGSKIAVAHNKNDCSETFLFNLFRGSGLKGLSGIRPVRGKIVRPLLCLERVEIERFLSQKGISYCIDQSNFEDNYTRNRIRHHILPVACKEVSVGAVSHIKEAGDKIAQAYELIETLVEEGYDSCVRIDETGLFVKKQELEKLPKTLQSYVCHRVLEQAAGSHKNIEAVHVQQMQELLENQCGKRVHLPYGLEAIREYDGICVRQQGQGAVEDASWEYVWNASDTQRLEQGETVDIRFPNGDALACKLLPTEKNIPTNPYTKWLDYDRIKDNIVIRHRRTGDYLTIQEDNHKKMLKTLLIDEKVPREQRDGLYLITQGSHVVWIIGGRISNYFKVSDDTQRMIEMRYIRRK